MIQAKNKLRSYKSKLAMGEDVDGVGFSDVAKTYE